MAFARGPKTVTDSLVLYLDAANPKSYPGTGTIARNLAGTSTGTLTNGTAYSSANGGYWTFDGVDDWIGFSSLTSYSSSDPHTYSAWVRFVNGSSYKWIIGNGAGGDSPGGVGGTSMIVYNSRIGFFWSGGATVRRGSINLSTNTWYNLVICYDGASLTYRFYVNAVLDTSSNTSTYTAGKFRPTWAANNYNPRIGAWFNDGFIFNGNISNVRIYNRSLTSQEVLQNYNTLKSRYNL